ncbi:hypothetical protein E1212_14420 [Jiangella ureilytica]|uniref:Uncharacterized protein n=1 Tax=Jiangella ureilytica TaxID=2530374 RepID=A0A4R4RLP9_9ACTN|nr:hypothetical protein [Jiangella ureilytica]TDC50567.1 hypothetical protein E1212_14420 [Jiangella ureilytica]
MRPLRPLRRLLVGLTLVVAVAMGAGAPAAAEPWRPAAAASVTVFVRSAPAADPPPARVVPDDADDRDDSGFGWGPSGIVWAGFGWLGLVLVAALVLRRRASRRR